MHKFLVVSAVLCAALISQGCINATVHLKAGDLRKPKPSQKSWKIFVEHFDDQRPDTKHIGEKKGNLLNNHLGWIQLPKGETLAGNMSQDYAARLKNAGFTAVDARDKRAKISGPYDAVLNGEIHVFLTTLNFVIKHNIELTLRLRPSKNGKVLWEKFYRAERVRESWMAASGEFDRVMNIAYNDVMQEALDDFASKEFEKALKDAK